MATTDYVVAGTNTKALFTLKAYRGEGMTLLAMNWKGNTKPPPDFVGFSIEYKEPGGQKYYAVRNRLGFDPGPGVNLGNTLSTRESPIQKFRWVHFPMNAEKEGLFRYRVSPVFMNDLDHLSYGEAQEIDIQLARETHPGKLNVAFTRGFMSSQAFVDKYVSAGPISTLLPDKAENGLKFTPTHPKTTEALAWMGFEARSAILEVLDLAIADTTAEVRVVAYDLSEPEIVTRLEKLGKRLKIIIDSSDKHGELKSGESQAATRLRKTAGTSGVRRQKMGDLQHNKTIVVGGKVKRVVCGSTNFAWRGFYVQANNAVILRGAKPVAVFGAAFDEYWKVQADETGTEFKKTTSATWNDLGLAGIDASATFSPHNAGNSVLKTIADDIKDTTTSTLFYSLAFLSNTPGLIQEAIKIATAKPKLFVYGISDAKVGGLSIQTPGNPNPVPVYAASLTENLPEPFKSEPTGLASGGLGNRMHHKFVVLDFDKPTARVYFGSYNFSKAADGSNGDNLLLIKDRRIATAFMVEAIRIFDHYHFRVKQETAPDPLLRLVLSRPPRKAGEVSWWEEDFTDPRKIRDRELFG